MTRRLRARLGRLRSCERGLGIVEVLFAIVITNVAILALFSAFSASTFSLVRASRVSNATVLAERQLELYRAMLYTNIGLDASLVGAADSTHTADSEWVSPTDQVVAASCSTALVRCMPQQTSVTGPDGLTYRIDTYIRAVTPTAGRAGKRVAVVVYSEGQRRARLVSNFDKATGCIVGSTTNPC